LAAAAVADYEQAIAHYNSVLETRPDFYEAWYERGLALEHRGYYPEAIASFDRALSLKPKNDATNEIWHDRGNALQYGLGEYMDAIACYDRVLQTNPAHELAWLNRGNAFLYGIYQAEEAILCYSRVLALNPENVLAWRNRGNALAELCRYEEAIASYDRALAMKPDDEVAWQARNQSVQRSGLNNYKQPTTNPAWYGSGYGDATFIDGDTDSESTRDEQPPVQDFVFCQGQPMLMIEDDSGKREIWLERDRYLIGRDPKSDICLHSKFASREHAVLVKVVQDNGRTTYQIIDGNLEGKPSTNGVLINGQKHRVWNLNHDDIIVFGPQLQATYRLLSPSHCS
jgi:pSer/pThr/pTyr-binding forkhead associated (FHA) protein